MSKQPVLVIDASANVRTLLGKWLTELGYTACLAEDLDAAQDSFSHNHVHAAVFGVTKLEDALACDQAIAAGWPGAGRVALVDDPALVARINADARLTFCAIERPFAPEQLREALLDAVARAQGLRRAQVLIVEDSSVVAKIARRAVEARGWKSRSAATMEEAIGLLSHSRVDVLVTDIFMPGMGGIEGIAQVRAQWPHIKVVAISGGLSARMGAANALKAAAKIGADGAVAKPFTATDLQVAIEPLLGKVDLRLAA